MSVEVINEIHNQGNFIKISSDQLTNKLKMDWKYNQLSALRRL